MKKLSIYAIALLATGGAQAATLVINGGFESGTVDSTPTGWTSGHTGNAEDPWVRAGENNGVTQVEGSNHLQFRGNSAAPTGGSFIEQTLTTAALTVYDLDFSLASTATSDNLSLLVTVTSDGGATGDLFNETFTFSGTTYTGYNREFTATNAGATLRFEETSTDSSSRDPFLDAVSVTTAVPEPSSAALLGLGAFALILRRRK